MPEPTHGRNGASAQTLAQIKRARSQETVGICCEACGSFMEFDLPVTFYESPLCEACESEAVDA